VLALPLLDQERSVVLVIELVFLNFSLDFVHHLLRRINQTILSHVIGQLDIAVPENTYQILELL